MERTQRDLGFVFINAGILKFRQHLSSCYAKSMSFKLMLLFLFGVRRTFGESTTYTITITSTVQQIKMFNNAVSPHTTFLMTVSCECPSFPPLSYLCQHRFTSSCGCTLWYLKRYRKNECQNHRRLTRIGRSVQKDGPHHHTPSR